MNPRSLIKHAERFTIANSPVILTAMGVVGVVTTAVLASRAGAAAKTVLENEYEDRRIAGHEQYPDGFHSTRKECVGLTWKLYIPTAVTGGLTIAAIVSANHIGTRRAAAIALAYSVSERAFEEYRSKVVDNIGESKERVIREQVAQDRFDSRGDRNSEVIILNGKQLCFDSYTGRTFESDMETIRAAVNTINGIILRDNYASLSDFYDLVGLNRTATSDDVGWNVDRTLEIEYSTVMTDDKRPAISIDFRPSPKPYYFRLH